MGARMASSTRAIGGSVRLDRPAPRMIGATRMCRRSRQRAARKRETVSAPPSIENPAEAAPGQGGDDGRGSQRAIVRRERHDLDAGRKPRRHAGGRDHEAADAVCRKHARGRRQAAARIDDHSRRARALDAPHRQLRIVRDRRAHSDHDRVDQRPQAVQVGKPGLAIDIMRVAGRRGDAGVERLAALRDQDEVVDRSLPQRPENVLPRLGQRPGTIGAAKRCRHWCPRCVPRNVRSTAPLGEAPVAHRGIPAFGACLGVS